ncbi:hypothetical protein MXB_4197 [Myxobolus squamalis]|nr:hypothetical protein MXB_4197 [Myxobolus squamalis]
MSTIFKENLMKCYKDDDYKDFYKIWVSIDLPDLNIHHFTSFNYYVDVDLNRFVFCPAIFYRAKYHPSNSKVVLQFFCKKDYHDGYFLKKKELIRLIANPHFIGIKCIQNIYFFVFIENN